jgi:hypothetical protein
MTNPPATVDKDGLREALTKCRDRFREYESQHEAKAKSAERDPSVSMYEYCYEYCSRKDKAESNRLMADMCDEALARQATGAGDDARQAAWAFFDGLDGPLRSAFDGLLDNDKAEAVDQLEDALAATPPDEALRKRLTKLYAQLSSGSKNYDAEAIADVLAALSSSRGVGR